MCDHTTAIYCFLDDFLKAMNHQEDTRCQFSDAEVLTTAVIAMLYFGGNFEKSRLVLHELGLMKRMLSRSRFSRRLHRLTDLLDIVFHQLGSILKDLNWESRYLLDSFPVPVCDNIRISRCRLVKDENYRGRIQSKRRYFYGVKVQVMTTIDGIPTEFCILPGSCHDLQGLAELPLENLQHSELFADTAYNNYEWEDYLQEIEQIKLQVPRKSNSKRIREPYIEDYKQIFRKHIETVFGEIAKMFPKKIHATTLNGFLLKISLFIFAYQLDKAFINN
jgi:hypothetical protein